MTDEFLGDPEKYAELAKPFESPEEANKVAEEFFNAVALLREQYRIPELNLQYELYVRVDTGIHVLRGGGGWGDQLRQARLAKRAADLETEHFFELVERILSRRPRLTRELITDPIVKKD